MAHLSMSSGEGFCGAPNPEVSPALISDVTSPRVVSDFDAPLIHYYYAVEDKYFGFGATEPEGVVIPMEIFEPGSPFRNAVTAWVDPQPAEIALGDEIRVDWTPLDGSAPFQSLPMAVDSKEHFILVGIPDAVISGFEGKTVEVIFVHLPQSGGARPSRSRFVYVAPALGSKPPLEVEGVVNGVLQASAFPDGIKVSVAPIANMRAYNAMEILWIHEPDHWVERQRRITVSAQKTTEFSVDPAVYQSHVGRRVTVLYRLYLGARLSPNFYWNPGAVGEVSFEII
ncbi:hypothetical protein GIW70_22615 [Pseudomonas syringae]|nr:hypothetical protein [Pseudomonas syringae]MCF5070975.1 hypothetical protein [Pseudomonas syringae]